MSYPKKYIPAKYNKDVYQAFLEGNPVKTVLAKCEHKKATGQLWDDLGFTINTPLGGYLGKYKGIDFRAYVLVCARSSGFKPKKSSNADISDGDKVLINTFVKLLYG